MKFECATRFVVMTRDALSRFPTVDHKDIDVHEPDVDGRDPFQ